VLFNVDLTNKVIVTLRHEMARVCSVSLKKNKTVFLQSGVFVHGILPV